jgi:hypothetical protein
VAHAFDGDEHTDPGQYIGGHLGDYGEDVPEFLCSYCEDDLDALVRVASVSTRH